MSTNNKVYKNIDSDASPFIEQKDVILCRSGIQMYHKTHLTSFINGGANPPPVEKEWYREYRPASVVVKAKKKCRSLPVTKEHPIEWVNSKNFNELAGGVTDKALDVVALDGDGDGEIGIQSNITFYTEELHDYYLDNKEVSLGYTCRKHWVDNPDEVGYDILLDEILEINHLAITKAGRGGSSVAIIDSLLGGLKPMKSGIFSFLAGKKQKDSEKGSFGSEVFNSIKNSKSTDEEGLKKEMASVLDSCKTLQDCKEKETLLNVVSDCFENKEEAIANKDSIVKALDDMYVTISGNSLQEIVSACSGMHTTSNVDAEIVADSQDGEEDKDKDEDSKDELPKDKKDKKDEKDKKEDKNTDSLTSPIVWTKDSILAIVQDSMKKVAVEAVQEALGVKKVSKNVDEEINTDSLDDGLDVISKDYTSYLER